MRRFEKQTFVDLRDRRPGAVIEDLEFVGCTFRSCSLSFARTPKTRTRVRRVTLRGCSARSCLMRSPVLEEVTIEGLANGPGPLLMWSALFDRVTLGGKLDSLVLSPRAVPPTAEGIDGAAFDAARRSFYEKIDWALDIRGAKAKNLEIYGVPPELVRRDPETQAFVRRESVLDEERWRGLTLEDTWWPTLLEGFLQRGDEHAILVTPLRHPHAKAFVEGLRLLRSVGVADPA